MEFAPCARSICARATGSIACSRATSAAALPDRSRSPPTPSGRRRATPACAATLPRLPSSALQSWRVTMRVGDGVTQYLRVRHAFDDVLARVAVHGPEAIDTLIEGVWFISIADDTANDNEAALIAHLVRTRPRESRWKLTA